MVLIDPLHCLDSGKEDGVRLTLALDDALKFTELFKNTLNQQKIPFAMLKSQDRQARVDELIRLIKRRASEVGIERGADRDSGGGDGRDREGEEEEGGGAGGDQGVPRGGAGSEGNLGGGDTARGAARGAARGGGGGGGEPSPNRCGSIDDGSITSAWIQRGVGLGQGEGGGDRGREGSGSVPNTFIRCFEVVYVHEKMNLNRSGQVKVTETSPELTRNREKQTGVE